MGWAISASLQSVMVPLNVPIVSPAAFTIWATSTFAMAMADRMESKEKTRFIETIRVMACMTDFFFPPSLCSMCSTVSMWEISLIAV